ncbi:hypothetical protein ACQPZA_29575 [Pseudonocardia xinjiangensis]|uniref:hypothetical protein n=1 Tax=Pseudonocardia xinjiangensis TaxID=75289 RepID=UPI003D8A0B0A
MADLSQIASSTRDSIGRYFSLVSALPSAMLVAWTVLLVDSGAWSGRPDLAAAVRGFTEIGIGGATGLVLLSLVLGVVLHPMQFAFVQFLEGYWGISRFARRMRFMRIQYHWDRLRRLDEKSGRIDGQIEDLQERQNHVREAELERLDRSIIELDSVKQEIDRLRAMAPTTADAIMPTRLGNVLRRYEWNVGKAYGIAAIHTVPYLSRVAAPGDMDYVNDQRSQLDLAVRMVIVSFAATGLAVLFLARHGLWLLVAVVPYLAGYVAYRGAVVAAGEYGRALGVLVTLNRFELYDRLRLEPLVNTDEERRRNEDLMSFLSHESVRGRSMKFQLPNPAEVDPAAN